MRLRLTSIEQSVLNTSVNWVLKLIRVNHGIIGPWSVIVLKQIKHRFNYKH